MNRLLSALLLLTASTTAFAQGLVNGVITFSPTATAVPIFGGFGLMLLGLLMGGAAFRVFRKRTSGHVSAISALAVGALVAATSGVHLVSDAWANSFTYEVITNPAGQTFVVPLHERISYCNESGVEMAVTQLVNPNSLVSCGSQIETVEPRLVPISCPEPTVPCKLGDTLANNEACFVISYVDC